MWNTSKVSAPRGARAAVAFGMGSLGLLFGLEFLVTAVHYKTEFAANGEYLKYLFGILFVSAFPAWCIAACTLVFRYGSAKRRQMVGALLGAVLGWSTSFGRHFDVLPVRVAFVVGIALLVTAVVRFAPHVASNLRRPLVVLVGLGSLWAELHILPNLYLGFHIACVAALAGCAIWLRAAPREAWSRHHRYEFDLLALFGGILPSLLGLLLLRNADNVRRIASEHGVLARYALQVAAATGKLSPPEGDTEHAEDSVSSSSVTAGSPPDWSGHDILLFTVDALRADRLGSYGYRRPTPHFDALAQRGTRFAHAYCPTPHTSYSVTSMMTGKYMHPLLSLGLGEQSDTVASWLQTYGYRTAAFYPPAVFYIDGPKFTAFDQGHLGFEYAKVEFAPRPLRVSQVRDYLQSAPKDKPLFLWVHAFEPHEPYVKHSEFDFGDTPSDRYDSEVAEADALFGEVQALMEASRPKTVVWVTADHGEEFGDHGGLYHGTTLYEEQVRVPLLVAGPGVLPGVVEGPVQTIDIATTLLSALKAPRPARVRGQDLGASLTHTAAPTTHAYADTDALSMYAQGDERLLCRKREAYCDLYNVAADPGERHNLSQAQPARAMQLRSAMRAVERAHGTYEKGVASDLPEALRRALSGEKDAAPEAAALLDDVRPLLRAKAAQALADIGSGPELQALERALARESDAPVRLWIRVALARAGGPAVPDVELATACLSSDDDLKLLATLQRASQGQGSYTDLERVWRNRDSLAMPRRLELLALMQRKYPAESALELAASLHDVVMRAEIVRALESLRDARTADALVRHYVSEPYVNLRPLELRALAAVGAAKRLEVARATAAYLAMPEPDEALREAARVIEAVRPSR